MGERILITGGAGYKGVILARQLLEEGREVTILDNFMYGHDHVLHLVRHPKLEVIKHDIRNGIENLERYDVIYHLAGISGYPACEANPHSAELINVEATRKLVEGLGKEQLLVYASTTSFYGKSGKMCDEDTPVDPVSMYGSTKYRAEQISMERENSISLRFATVFGLSPKMRLDLMVNDFTYKAIKEGIVILFDSYAKRTFIHIEDVGAVYRFCMEKRDAMAGGIYNAGGQHLNFSKLEIAEKVRSYVEYNIIDSAVKDRDVRHFLTSYEKIAKLGWTPKLTVEDGIEELIRAYRFYEPFSHFKTI